MSEPFDLSRRERQIMAIIYARGQASASAVRDAIPDAPTRTSVRTLLRILEGKGHLRHEKVGREFVYYPIQARQRAGHSALQRVLHTFFDGSLEQAVAVYLADRETRVNPDELRRLSALIRQAKNKGDK